MRKDFCIGIILGMLGGAILICNVPQVKTAYEKGQSFVVNKIAGLCKKKSEDDQPSDEDEMPDYDEQSGQPGMNEQTEPDKQSEKTKKQSKKQTAES